MMSHSYCNTLFFRNQSHELLFISRLFWFHLFGYSFLAIANYALSIYALITDNDKTIDETIISSVALIVGMTCSGILNFILTEVNKLDGEYVRMNVLHIWNAGQLVFIAGFFIWFTIAKAFALESSIEIDTGILVLSMMYVTIFNLVLYKIHFFFNARNSIETI